VTDERHPTQQELLAGAIRTLEEVLIPELGSDRARTSAMGLLDQLHYALERAASDSLAAQNATLAQCLGELCREFIELHEMAAAIEDSDDASWDLRERAGRMLVFAQDGDSAAAVAVRTRLQPLLIAHVEQDFFGRG
jgi:hypothetical protein